MSAETVSLGTVEAVGFDLDGTLFDHRGSATDAVSAFLSDFALGLDASFDTVCLSEAIGFQKPDARAFDALARSLDVEPHRCLFVGDSADKDVAGATAAGMRALLIERHDGSASSLAAVIESALLAG